MAENRIGKAIQKARGSIPKAFRDWRMRREGRLEIYDGR
jgi:hypothetical protein